MSMILVTAAFGHQGKLLIPKLAAAGFKVRAARGTPGRDDELLRLGASEVFVGALDDPDVYAQALDGCDAVYHIGPSAHPREKEMGFSLIEAAKRCGTRHVVFNSNMHTIVNMIQHLIKRDIEEALIESGLQYTFIRPAEYMHWDLHMAAPVHTGTLPCFWGDLSRRHSMIDLGDLTDAVLRVLVEGGRHYYAAYDLSGGEKLSPPEIARILSRVIGRDVQAVSKTYEDMLEALFGTREPSGEFQHQADVLRSITDWCARYDPLGCPTILEWLLGRPSTTFEQFATKAYVEFIAGKS